MDVASNNLGVALAKRRGCSVSVPSGTRQWDLSWRAARELPEGPVTLWMAVFSDARQLLGSAPMTSPPSWLWMNGRLNLDYGIVHVSVLAEGRYQTAFIIAVSGGRYVPVFRISLGKPQLVGPGMNMIITDGRIEITPEADFDAFGTRR